MAERGIITNEWYNAGTGIGAGGGLQPDADWKNLPLAVMLLRNDGTGLGAEFFAMSDAMIKKVTTIEELLGPSFQGVELSAIGYARQLWSPDSLLRSATGADDGRWTMQSDVITFGASVTASPQQSIQGLVVYTGGSGTILNRAFDALNVPLYVYEFEIAARTSGIQVTATLDDPYLFLAQQAS